MHPLEVAGRWDECAARVLHRFEVDGATVSGPSISIRMAMSSAHRNVHASRCGQSVQRYRLVFCTLIAPGTSGSNGALIAGIPLIDRAPKDVP